MSRTTYSRAIAVERAGREARRDARGDAAEAQQQRHRARELLAVALAPAEEEVRERGIAAPRVLGVRVALA